MKKINLNYISSKDSEQSLGDLSPERQKIRPTSPHLQIYKWEWTMAYSILHRVSAIGVGVIMILVFIITLITGNDYTFYDAIHEMLLAKLLYIGGVSCIFYYIFATLKYMIWQTTAGLDLKLAKRLGDISVIATVICTAGVVYNANIF